MAVISYFSTRNQLDRFNNEAGVNFLQSRKATLKRPAMADKGKSRLESDNSGLDNGAQTIGGSRRKVVRVQGITPGAEKGNRLKVVNVDGSDPNVTANSDTAHKKKPIPTDRDNGVLATIMSRNGPTYGQMIDGPHEQFCKSRQPHKFPEHTHFPWPPFSEGSGLAKELMGPIQVDKYEPTLTLYHDPLDVTEEIHPCPQARKRKASLNLMPYIPRIEENTKEFTKELPVMEPFSPSHSNSSFKVGAGHPSTSSKNEKKKRMRTRSQSSIPKKKMARQGGDADENIVRNLEESLNLVEESTVQALLAWVGKFKVDSIYLMETKLGKEHMEGAARVLGFSRIVCQPAIGLARGFCLMWKHDVNLNVVSSSGGSFAAEVWDHHSREHWMLYATYGTVYLTDKSKFWSDLSSKVCTCDIPWVVLGDLNCIGSPEEKIGGRRVTHSDLKWLTGFLNDTGGVDIRCKGGKFTWHNKRFKDGLIRERLDRAVGSIDWITNFIEAGVTNLPITCSDNAAIILDTNLFSKKSRIPFRFFDAWTRDESCREVIKKAWNSDAATASGRFMRNIGNTRSARAKWKQSFFREMDKVIRGYEDRISWIQKQPLQQDLSDEEAELNEKLSLAWRCKEDMWRQKSGDIWLKLGDRNSRFFHASVAVRKRRNHIWGLRDKQDVLWESRGKMEGIINSYFNEIFSSIDPKFSDNFDSLFHNQISHEVNEELTALPSPEEIRGAVFEMHPLKAPGPDCFSGCFYRKYWEIIGPLVIDSTQEFFRTGIMNSQVNHTFICLIPKVDHPERIDQFRPISLCNFQYKIIAKIFSNRLRPIMEDLVSPVQPAFIPGRWIAKTSILTQELVHKIRRSKGKGGLMAIKLDMHKAYDKMEWRFLDRVLMKNGFNDKARSLIMTCVTGVSYSVLLNGSPLKKFAPLRGLRQGDPLSPFLFLLCQEVLSKLISQAEGQGRIHGIKIARDAPSVSHLMFADDTILFTRANVREASEIMKCLSTYEAWSGQTCSKTKSSVLFSQNTVRKAEVLQALGIDHVNGQEKHLGNPFVFKRRKSEEYQFLKNNMRKRLEGWKTKSLSYAGRLTLIKSVTSSLPVYNMSTMKIPLSICRAMDAMVRKFWWIGSADKDRSLAYKAWNSICQPKSSGGLGIRSYENFWTVSPRQSDSYGWKNVLEVRNVILKGSLAMAADGSLVDAWRQPWIPWLNHEEFGQLMEQLRRNRFTFQTLADLSNGTAWNEEIVFQVFGETMGKRITEIPRLPPNHKDQVIWKENKSGVFSVKSAYWVDQGHRMNPKKDILKWIWKGEMHPRLSVSLWRFLNEAIPTRNKLPFVEDKECLLCGLEQETCLHIFRDCEVSRALWISGIFPLTIGNFPGSSMIEFVELVMKTIPIGIRPNFLMHMARVFEEIWRLRNGIIFKGGQPNLSLSIMRVRKNYGEFMSMTERVEPTPMPLPQSPCSFTRDFEVVLVTDAAWSEGSAGLAAVLINIIDGSWMYKVERAAAGSALEAETKAIWMAISWIKQRTAERIVRTSRQKCVWQVHMGGDIHKLQMVFCEAPDRPPICQPEKMGATPGKGDSTSKSHKEDKSCGRLGRVVNIPARRNTARDTEQGYKSLDFFFNKLSQIS
uniref:Reverse transcriptase domain-containing protein n=1 Tax=Cannabis sativa TaxID=3483 RepID=A0A803NTT8_CANSA